MRQKKHEIKIDVIGLLEERNEVQKDYSEYVGLSRNLDEIVDQYENGWQYKLQEPAGLMSAKSYKEKYVELLLASFPVVKKNESTGEFEEVGTAKIQWWPQE